MLTSVGCARAPDESEHGILKIGYVDVCDRR